MKARFSNTTLAAVLSVIAATNVFTQGGPAVDIPTRVRGADAVVVAQATRVTPHWERNAFGDEWIVSEVVLQVEEALKGTPAALVAVEVAGGTLGDLTMHVSTLPDVRPGERGVFFLQAAADGSYRPHGQGQGILKLDASNQVQGSSLRLDEIRRLAQSAGR